MRIQNFLLRRNLFFRFFLKICGALIVVFSFISDFLRGRPFLLGWSQISLSFLGIAIILFGFYFKKTITFLFRFLTVCVNFIKNHPWVSIIPIIIAALFFVWPTPNDGLYTPDVAYYLSLAKNIFLGNGYVNPDLSPALYRGPGYPYLISLSYILFGNSLISALILMRLFWFFTVVITYILSKELFNHRVAFMASFFVITANVISDSYNRIWTDGIVTFLVLLLMLILWKIIKSNHNVKWYIGLGIIAGLAYLVKQTAIIIVPLPILIWFIFPEYRTRQNLRNISIFIFVFALFFFGWMGYIYLAGGSPGQVTRDLSIGTNVLNYVTNSFSNTKEIIANSADRVNRSSSIPEILLKFYNRDIGNYFNYALLFLVGILFSIYHALVKKSKPAIFLICGLILFSSMIPANVINNFGARQNLYFYIITLICIAFFFDRIINLVKNFQLPLILLISSAMVFIQVSKGIPQVSDFSTHRNSFIYSFDYSETAEWIIENIKTDENILTSERESNYFHILTPENRVIYPILTCTGESSFYIAEKCSQPYISLWIYQGIKDPDTPRDFLSGISEDSLISIINEKNIDYIIVTEKIYSLYYYLNLHPNFEKVAVFRNAVIFKVKSPVQYISDYPKTNFITCIGIGTKEYFSNLKTKYPESYEAKFKSVYSPWMGLSTQDLDNIVNESDCLFNANFPGDFKVFQQ